MKYIMYLLNINDDHDNNIHMGHTGRWLIDNVIYSFNKIIYIIKSM